ncbi:Murein tripeptide amidase MpaA [Nannocystis exedens]|uniref:Murein tripeptide amidase MpaA n=1 Tax=Nannocystis exedens TaxID=54 RepID=A0A1I2AXA1_9BACT|nr:M14-type cytosolic carboxypeptidase [Nannocystis exedens]PCC74335.1 Zinc carboxypeptidase [Nannocystis exedens]SFE48591.1 Murein tripeptide amidase MpaA [Nannocystis exedens]
MQITSNFDGGNILVRDIADPGDAHLEIRRDNNSDFYQWFYFRASGVRDTPLALHIDNAGSSSYPPGWKDYRAVASYDRELWFRVPTDYDGKRLTIRHTPEHDSVWYAYFAPYSHERHQDLVAACQTSPRCRHELLGATLDGRDLDLLVIGEPAADKRVCWIVARQHPGETMAEWLMEGLLERLLDDEDPVARQLLARAVFYCVPNMNPDGAFRGNLRTNAAGANLNREWQEPTRERSPEVYYVRKRMEQTGVDFCLDVHGDEALPYNFIAGPDGVASVTRRVLDLQDEYERLLMRSSPDFQLEHGYDAVAPGAANMTMCTTFVADRFGCLSMTLEQPFKDTADSPHELVGWSPERCRKLGRANLDALYGVLDRLR